MSSTIADFKRAPETSEISEAKTRTGSSGAQSLGMTSNLGTLKPRIKNGVGLVTKKYLQQIEEKYTRNEPS
jgi:hypothetical protein